VRDGVAHAREQVDGDHAGAAGVSNYPAHRSSVTSKAQQRVVARLTVPLAIKVISERERHAARIVTWSRLWSADWLNRFKSHL
jgi:hypothetical protein